MTERPTVTDRIRTLHTQADALLSRLAAHALEDQAAAAWPSAGDGPYVSSSSMSNPTESAGIHDRLSKAGDHQLVERAFAQVVSLLTRIEERTTPYQATGEACPTVARNSHGESVYCTGTVTHFRTGRGLCESCDEWLGKRQHRGLDMPADVLKARNARQPRWCQCGPGCCPQDDKGHTSCTDKAAEGRQLSDRCRERTTGNRRCTCGPDCCPDGCNDDQAPSRRVSERCLKRQQRAKATTSEPA